MPKKDRSPTSFRRKQKANQGRPLEQHVSSKARFHFHSWTEITLSHHRGYHSTFFFLQECKNVSRFALYCCSLKTAFILSSELSRTKGHHFEMFMAVVHGSFISHYLHNINIERKV